MSVILLLQVFYRTHLLYIPFLVLCILHGPVFWCYFVLPGTLFAAEKAAAVYFWLKQHRSGRQNEFVIDEVHLLPSKVLCIYYRQFSVPQIEYLLGGSSIKGSHVYFLLIVAMVLLLLCQLVLLWHQVTIVASEQHLYQTIVLPWKLATRSIRDYFSCYCPLVGLQFEVLRIKFVLQSYWMFR